MTNTVPMLTPEEKLLLLRKAPNYTVPGDFFIAGVNAGERAVRAQFEARIQVLESEVTQRICNEASACNYVVERIAERDQLAEQLHVVNNEFAVILSERDAARAQVARLREALEQLIACHDEPTCPALDVARAALQEQSHE